MAFVGEKLIKSMRAAAVATLPSLVMFCLSISIANDCLGTSDRSATASAASRCRKPPPALSVFRFKNDQSDLPAARHRCFCSFDSFSSGSKTKPVCTSK